MTFRPRLPKPVASGFAVEGPGFYVWQETEAEALDWQRELSGPPKPGPRLVPSPRRRGKGLAGRRLPSAPAN